MPLLQPSYAFSYVGNDDASDDEYFHAYLRGHLRVASSYSFFDLYVGYDDFYEDLDPVDLKGHDEGYLEGYDDLYFDELPEDLREFYEHPYLQGLGADDLVYYDDFYELQKG